MKLLRSKRIFLRGIEARDLNKRYIDWLNDSEVNRYLETRFSPQTEESIHAYWEKHHNDLTSPWFAICLVNDSLHIGNIKLGPIDFTHKSARISYFIGEKKLWGKGYATLAIKEIAKKAKKKGIKKLKAGLYEVNIGSKKALVKNGFKLEGKLQSEISFKGKRISLYLFGKIL